MTVKIPDWEQLLNDARACSLCAPHLPDGPRPVLQLHPRARVLVAAQAPGRPPTPRSEEHTSELQSRRHLVCRLLLVKKNSKAISPTCTFSPPLFSIVNLSPVSKT